MSEYGIGQDLCGFARRQRTKKSWGSGSSGMGWMDTDCADLQGTQDSAAPREQQGQRRALRVSSAHATRGTGIRSVGTPNCVTRPEGNSLGWSVMGAEF